MSDDFNSKMWHRLIETDRLPAPHGWVQWKGTDVCIDLHCKCGHHGHYDGDFLYFYECPECHQRYAVGQSVKLIELTAEEGEHVEKSGGSGFKTDEDHEA